MSSKSPYAFSVPKDASLDKLTKYFEVRNFPKQNLLYWGIKFRILWDDERVDINSFGTNFKNIIDRLDLEINRRIQVSFPNHTIQVVGHIPKYLMSGLGIKLQDITDKDLTPEERKELSDRSSPSKSPIIIHPIQEFYKEIYKKIRNGYKAGGEIKNWAKDILTNLYFTKLPYPYRVTGGMKQTSRSSNNDEILTFSKLGIAYLKVSDMHAIVDNKYFTYILPVILRNQKRWVRKLQRDEIIRFYNDSLLRGSYLLDVKKSNTYIAQMLSYANFSHIRHYVNKMNRFEKLAIHVSLDCLTKSKNLKTKNAKLKKMMKNKWIPENQLVINFKRDPQYLSQLLPDILQKAIKMKDDEFPVIEFISFIYQLPEILEKRNFNFPGENPFFYVYEDIKNNIKVLKYLIECNYKPLREISSYAKEEILGAVDIALYNIEKRAYKVKEDDFGFMKIKRVPSNFNRWNKFLSAENCKIIDINPEIDIKTIELIYEETFGYHSYIETYKKGGEVVVTLGKKIIESDDEWILGWGSVFSNPDISINVPEGTNNLVIEQSYTSTNLIPKQLMDKIFEDSFPAESPYLHLQFLYNTELKRMIIGFDSVVCSRMRKGENLMKGIVKIWKPESFLRYTKPLFQLL